MSPFRFALVVLAIAFSTTVLFAQIPNAGFESWTSGEPDGWITPNVPGIAVPVTQSTDRHSGSFAARGDVAAFLGFPIAPSLTSEADSLGGFPVSQRHASLTGWYKMNSVAGDRVLAYVLMYDAQGDSGLGGGSVLLGGASGFTPFSVPIVYFSGTVPSRCVIQLTLIPADTATAPHLGSWFIVDELAFSGVNAVEPVPAPLPTNARLDQNFPNPFNPTTNIEFQLPQSGPATLEVFDMLGRRVATVLDEAMQAGTYRLAFDAAELPSGTYLYRLSAGDFVQTRAMVLLR